MKILPVKDFVWVKRWWSTPWDAVFRGNLSHLFLLFRKTCIFYIVLCLGNSVCFIIQNYENQVYVITLQINSKTSVKDIFFCSAATLLLEHKSPIKTIFTVPWRKMALILYNCGVVNQVLTKTLLQIPYFVYSIIKLHSYRPEMLMQSGIMEAVFAL